MLPSHHPIVRIDRLWLYTDYSTPCFKERIIPSGTIELVINLNDDELRIYDAAQPERCERFPGALISGAYPIELFEPASRP